MLQSWLTLCPWPSRKGIGRPKGPLPWKSPAGPGLLNCLRAYFGRHILGATGQAAKGPPIRAALNGP